MTLFISVFSRSPLGDVVGNVEVPGGSALMGVESCRSSLWGSASLARRATYLPRLADSDLWVEASELDAFEMECLDLLSDLSSISKETGFPCDFVRHRLENCLRAVETARSVVNVGICVS